jgi:MFS family permease
MTQMLTGIGAVLGCFIGPLIGARMGRRPAYFLLCFLSLITCGLLFRFVRDYSSSFLLLTFLVGCTTAAMYGWLPLYLPELFPTAVRATGQGICYNSGRLFAAVGSIEMGRLMQFYHGSYARAGATITLIYAAGLLLIWLGPETRGRALPA